MCFRVPFDWAFIQCGSEQLSKAEYRHFLTSTIFDDPQPFFEAKFALCVITHRLLPEQSCYSVGPSALLLIADIMRAGRSSLHEENFMRLKEHLFGLPGISALLMSSKINSEMIEQGIESIMPRVTCLDALTFRHTPDSCCNRGSNQSR